jgi:cytochrome c oxidase subunit 1
VLFGGSVFGIYSGVYYWWPKITGRMMSYKLGVAHFWATFVAFNVTFLPMHWVGLQGMPRRVAQYRPEFQFGTTSNRLVRSSSPRRRSSSCTPPSAVCCAGKGAGESLGARTLEWQISSPPPYYNFRKIPSVLKMPYDFGEPLPYIGLERDGSNPESPSVTHRLPLTPRIE